MSNNYGAFASITTDVAGTEHAVWEHQGFLWYTYFDTTSNQWSNAKPVSDASGGSDLQLITGDFIPYSDSLGELQYAPGLAAVWEEAGGTLSYAIGRYIDGDKLQWSNTVNLDPPTVGPGQVLLSQNPRAGISPALGVNDPPTLTTVYEIFDASVSANTFPLWTGTDGYTVNLDFVGVDQNNDGLISGRGTTNTLGDGVANELLDWTLTVLDPTGAPQATYTLDDQQRLSTFNFNFDPTTNQVLANADAEVFSIQNSQFGLNVGLDRTAEPSNDVWSLMSQVTNEQIVLQQIPENTTTPVEIDASALNNTLIPSGSLTTDDTDLYFETITFAVDGDNLKEAGPGGKSVIFELEVPLSPQYQSFGPEAQFLTGDVINGANSDNDAGLGSASNTSIATTPIGATIGFEIPLSGVQQLLGQSVPLPSSLVQLTNKIPNLTIVGSIGAVQRTGFIKNGEKTYVLTSSLALKTADGDDDEDDLNDSNASFANAAKNGTNSTADELEEETDFSVTVEFNSNFIPNEEGDLEYDSQDIKLIVDYGTSAGLTLEVPPSPSAFQGDLLKGGINYSVLNFGADVDFELESKEENGNPTATLLPIYLSGNEDEGNIAVQNSTLLNVLDGVAGGAAAVPQSLVQLVSELAKAEQSAGNDDGQAVSVLNNIDYAVEFLLGLLYSEQIVQQAGYLFDNLDQYIVDEAEIGFDWSPSISGTVAALKDLLKVSGGGNLEADLDIDLSPDGETTTLDFKETAAFSGKVLFWNWSWSSGYEQNIVLNGGDNATPLLALNSLEASNTNGDVRVSYNPTTGTPNLYGDNPVRGEEQTADDLTDDDDVAVAFDPYSNEGVLAWVAAGAGVTQAGTNISSLPLSNQEQVVSRIFTADFTSGAAWSSPELINQQTFEKGDGSLEGFIFDPSVEFFFVNASTFEVVDPDSIDFNPTTGNRDEFDLVRMVVWAYADTSKQDLDENSTPEEVQAAVQDTDLYYSWSKRNLAEGQEWGDWSAADLVINQAGTDSLPTLGRSADGTLRLAWVNQQTSDDNIVYTTTVKPVVDGNNTLQDFAWTPIEQAGDQTDLQISSLLIDDFGDNPVIYWTDVIDPTYRAAVLQSDPALYYRLDNSGSTNETNLGNLGSSSNGTYTDGTVTIVNEGALFDDTTEEGDPNASAQFTTDGGYLTIPVGQSTLGPSYTVELWAKLDSTEAGQVLLQKQQLPAALSLDGTNAFVDVTDYQGITGTNPRTVEAWVNTSSSGVQPIVNWGPNVEGQRWQVGLSDGLLFVDASAGKFIKGSTDLRGGWNHIAVTWEDDGSPNITDAKLYVNGELETISESVSQTINTSADGNISIGKNTDSTPAFFDGELSDVRIWDEARTQTEIQDNRLALLNTEATQENLVGRYTFSDNTANDASPAQNNGSLEGDATIVFDTDDTSGLPLDPDWSLKTGDNGTLVFDVGSVEVSTDALSTDDWYYVVATVDATVNGSPTDPVTTLYLNGVLVDQQQGPANLITDSVVTAGEGFAGQLDEIALYNRVLGKQVVPETDSNGNVTNYTTSPTSAGAIDVHYAARFNPTENIVGDGTYYTVLEDEAWSTPALFKPQQKLFPSTPLLERVPTFDVVSTTALEPDNLVDLYTQFSLSRRSPTASIPDPSQVIQAVTVTSPDGSTSWSTNFATNGDLPLAIVRDGTLRNDASGFEQTLLSGNSITFDLYFQGTSQSGDYTVAVTFSDATTASQSVILLPNPSASGSVGDIISAKGDILENELSSLAQLDSGISLETSADYVGTAMVSGGFLDGDTAIAIASPYANTGNGTVLLLPAGAELNTNVTNNNPLDPTQVPSGGVLITGSGKEQLGFALAAGDINGDGIDDLVIGAPRADDNESETGLIYVVLGTELDPGATGKTLDLSQPNPNVLTISGFAAASEAGSALAVGDLDNDGFDDIVIGAPFANAGAGEVYVVKGRNSFANVTNPTVLFTGEANSNSQAGFSVDIVPKNSSSGDTLNNDAFADVVIGAPGYRQEVTFNANFENAAAATAANGAIEALLAVTSVLPDNTNNTDSDNIDLNTGRAYALVSNNTAVTTNASTVTFDGSPIFNSDAQAGFSVSGAGDINGDGFEDLVIGAPADGKGAGIAYVVAGRTSFASTLQLAWESNLLIAGPEAKARTGSVVSDAGDFNSDGASDLVVSSPNAGFSAGQAHVLFGNSSESKNPLWSDDYSTAFSLAPGVTQNTAFFNLSGNPSPDPNIGIFVLNGTNPQDAMLPTRGAADVNGDGVDDLLASAQLGNQVGILFGHPWLADEGSLKIKDLKSDQGFIVESDPSLTDVLSLDGNTNDFVDVSGYKGVTGTTARTIEAWIKTGAGDTQAIASWGSPGSGTRWQAVVQDNVLRLDIDGFFRAGTTKLNDNQWHHVAITWEEVNGSNSILNAKLYVDGELETISPDSSKNGSVSTPVTGTDVRIGASADSPTALFFDGEIDEVRIWSEARSQNEIQANRNLTLSGKEPNLEAYYTFDDKTANDSSGNNRDGTLQGNAEITAAITPLSLAQTAVNLVGDLNGDGYAETLVAGNANQSTIVFGASTQELLDGGLATRELTLTHNAAPEYAAVGDVNGDGFQDLVAVLTDTLELALLLGSAELATQGTQALAALTTKSLTDTVEDILPALDINGDGLNDWITKSANAINLYFGQADGTIADLVAINAPVESAVKDLNQDGISDLVGINSNAEPVITFGASNFSSNQVSMTLSALPETASDYQFTNAGDVNGDGKGDFAISLADKGTVILAVSQGTNGTASYEYLTLVDGSTDTLTISTGGDINGDGLDDLVIGNPNASPIDSETQQVIPNGGEVFLVFGGLELESANLTELKPGSGAVRGLNITGLENSKAGTSVSGGEDVNGDGLGDFAIGAPGVDNLSYLLFGGDFTAALIQVGTLANDVLQGTATGDAMIGNSGTDFFLGNGGIDALSGGSGNDVFTIADTNFRRIDGGSGLDVLKLEGELNQSWDLKELARSGRIEDLEVIDITGYGSNRVLIDANAVLGLSSTSNTVFVDADAGTGFETDTVIVEGNFANEGVVSSNGVNYEKYVNEEATLLVTPGVIIEQNSGRNLTVVTTNDVVNGNTDSIDKLLLDPGPDGISLREAIEATNNTEGADSIDFEDSLAGQQIILRQGALIIKDDLTITGPETSGITLDANGRSRVFTVSDQDPSTTKNVVLSDLTITNGNVSGGGGGIFNLEKLTIQNSLVTGNQSSATNSYTGSAFGGGILNARTLILENSTISSNTALEGGGGIANIYLANINPGPVSTTVVEESTISGNVTGGVGGGIASLVGELAIYQSTLSGNTAGTLGGGVLNTVGATEIFNSTLSGNNAIEGAAVNSYLGALALTNSTVANNRILRQSNFNASLSLGRGSISYLTNSTISDTARGVDVFVVPSGAQVTTTGVNIVADGSYKDSNTLNVDPKLGPLAENGGPTQTHLPQTGSPAINATTTGLPTDQRGVRRPQGSQFDIGAVEIQATSLTSRDNIVNAFDPTPRIFVSEPLVSEADGIAQFTVVRTGDITKALTLNYTTYDGTANAGVHFTPREGKIIFAPEETMTVVTILIPDDGTLRQTIRNFELRITEDFEIGSSLNLPVLAGDGDDVVQGNDHPNLILGEAGADHLFGDTGEDTLRGGQGDDQLFGGADNDLLSGGSGTNTMTGGLGNDVFEITAGETTIVTDFGGMGRGSQPSEETRAALDTLRFTTEGLTAENLQINQVAADLHLSFISDAMETLVILQNFELENFDNLLKKTGATVDFDNIEFVDDALNDSIDVFNTGSRRHRIWNRNSVTFLNDRENRVRGFSHSDDVINGQGGDDTLRGLSGDDILRGGDGDDRLQGGRDDDLLRGGLGDDTLIGGHGRDTFVLAVGDGTDTIQDFKKRTDLIGLSNGLSFGQLSFRGRQIRFENEVLAILQGVRAEQLGEESFIEV